jgi:hypothetical protein
LAVAPSERSTKVSKYSALTRYIGQAIKTGEEVAIKLVSARAVKVSPSRHISSFLVIV